MFEIFRELYNEKDIKLKQSEEQIDNSPILTNNTTRKIKSSPAITTLVDQNPIKNMTKEEVYNKYIKALKYYKENEGKEIYDLWLDSKSIFKYL